MKVGDLKLDLTIISQRSDESPEYAYKKIEHLYLAALYKRIPESGRNADQFDEITLIEIHKITGKRLDKSLVRDDQEIRNLYSDIYQSVARQLISPAYVKSFIQDIESQTHKTVWSKLISHPINKPLTAQSAVERQYLKELARLIPTDNDNCIPLKIEILLELLAMIRLRIINTTNIYDIGVEKKIRDQYKAFSREVDLRVQTLLAKRTPKPEYREKLKLMTVADVRHFVARFHRRFSAKPSVVAPRYATEKQYIDQLLTLFPKTIPDSTVVSKNQFIGMDKILKARVKAQHVKGLKHDAMALYFDGLAVKVHAHSDTLTVGWVRKSLLGFVKFGLPSKVKNAHPRFSIELPYLTSILALFPKDLNGGLEITRTQYQEIMVIFRERDMDLRPTTHHYTKQTLDPMNLNYIEFAARIGKANNIPIEQVLMHVDNVECVNLSYAIKSLNFKHPNPQATESLHKYNVVRENNMIRYAPPELYGIYFCDNRIYSVLGLYAINGATFVKAHVRSDNNRSIYLLDLSNPVVFKSLYTFNATQQKRALHVNEIEQLMCIPDTYDDSKSLPLRVNKDDVYQTAWAPIKEMGVPSWKNQGTLDYDLVFNLIECYLESDPIYSSRPKPWSERFTRWCSDLLLKYDKTGKVIAFRPVSDVNCLYGQVIVSGKSYFYEHIVSILRDSSEENLHKNMVDITAWYCRNGDINNLFTKSKAHFKNAMARGDDYFLLEETRHEKLLKSLSDEEIIFKNYRKFMIESLTQDEDPFSQDSITKIPFQHSILSADGTKIYDLRHCKEHYEKHGVFLNRNLVKITFFEPSELNRIRKNPNYVMCFSHYEDEENARSICRISNSRLKSSTIRLMRDFINTVYHYDSEHTEIACETADDFVTDEFAKFYQAYSALDPIEKEKLDEYQVFSKRRGKRVPIVEIISEITSYWPAIDSSKMPSNRLQIQKNDTWCLNEILSPLLQMVVDHEELGSFRFRPYLEYMPHAEEGGPSMLAVLRSKSHKLLCSDNDKDATRKLKILLSKMMLELPICSVAEMAGPRQFCQNIINDLMPKINAQQIDRSIEGAHSLYTVMIEERVKPELERAKNLVESYRLRKFSVSTEYENYAAFLKTIQLHFSEDETEWYEMGFLLARLRKRKDLNLDRDEVLLSKFNQKYTELVGLYAQKISYLLNPMSADTAKQYEKIVDFFTNEQIDIRTFPKTMQTHMLDVQANLSWQQFLRSITHEQSLIFTRFVEKGSPSNSFDLKGSVAKMS